MVFYLPSISAFLAPGERPPTGGAETQIFLLARELARRGHRIGVVCFPVPGGVPPETDGISAITRPPPQWRRIGPLGKMLEVLAIWHTFVHFQTPVVVQRSSGFETGLVALAARLRGMSFIYSSASVADFEYERLDQGRRNRLLFHLGVRLAETIVVQSSEQVGLCQPRFGRTPTLIRSATAAHASRVPVDRTPRFVQAAA